jgi:hypothetical protein
MRNEMMTPFSYADNTASFSGELINTFNKAGNKSNHEMLK